MPFPRVLCFLGLCMCLSATAAETTKDSPFGQAGTTAVTTASLDDLDFAGVSTVGNRTMINLYDKQQKRSYWVQVGTKSGDVTIEKYDSAHDQITVRRNGTEKLLPLRPPSAVVNGTGATAVGPVDSPALSAAAPAASATTGTPSLSQARQEEEARMLVSDLLEIGMAQRRAYEEAQRRVANGQPAHPATAPEVLPPTEAPAAAAPGAPSPAAPATPTTAATPSS